MFNFETKKIKIQRKTFRFQPTKSPQMQTTYDYIFSIGDL